MVRGPLVAAGRARRAAAAGAACSEAQNVFAQSGGAYDRRRDRYIVYGGGHMDCAGHDIYVFDLATLRLSRASEPAANTGGDESSGYYPSGDGAPPSTGSTALAPFVQLRPVRRRVQIVLYLRERRPLSFAKLGAVGVQ